MSKDLRTIVIAVVTTLAVGFVGAPLVAAYALTPDQVRAIGAQVWAWLRGPEPMVWFVAAVVVAGLVMIPRHNPVGPRVRRLGGWLWVSTVAALVYRVIWGYPSGSPGTDPSKDPALWVLLAGPAAWAATEAVSVVVWAAKELVSIEFQDRDGRWILREREGRDPGRKSGDWDKVFRCNVPTHRPMRGNETCVHELAAARHRPWRSRWLMKGSLPQEFKNSGSPDYDPQVLRATLEPDTPISPRYDTADEFRLRLMRMGKPQAPEGVGEASPESR